MRRAAVRQENPPGAESAPEGTGDATPAAGVTGPIKLTPEEAEQVRTAIREVFDSVDLDKDGYIDAAEVETVLRRSTDEKTDDVELTDEQIKNVSDEFFKLVDANADAKVSFDELFNATLKEAGYEV